MRKAKRQTARCHLFSKVDRTKPSKTAKTRGRYQAVFQHQNRLERYNSSLEKEVHVTKTRLGWIGRDEYVGTPCILRKEGTNGMCISHLLCPVLMNTSSSEINITNNLVVGSLGLPRTAHRRPTQERKDRRNNIYYIQQERK